MGQTTLKQAKTTIDQLDFATKARLRYKRVGFGKP